MKSGSNAWLHAFFSRSNDKDVTWKTSPNPVFELEDEPDNIDTYFPIHLYLCLQTFGCASIPLSSQVPIQLKTSETQPKVWASFQEQKERESSSLFGSEVVEHLWINIYGYKQPFNSFCFIFKKKKTFAYRLARRYVSQNVLHSPRKSQGGRIWTATFPGLLQYCSCSQLKWAVVSRDRIYGIYLPTIFYYFAMISWIAIVA